MYDLYSTFYFPSLYGYNYFTFYKFIIKVVAHFSKFYIKFHDPTKANLMSFSNRCSDGYDFNIIYSKNLRSAKIGWPLVALCS
jgi:hypothetical protein